MNWDAVGAVGEIGGALAVVATLVYLSIQIRNNTSMTRAAIRQARAEWGLQQAGVFSNSDHLPEIMVRLESGERLDKADDLRWRFFVTAWHRAHEITLLQHRDGLIDDSALESLAEVLRHTRSIGSPFFADWERIKFFLDPDYVGFVDSLEGDT